MFKGPMVEFTKKLPLDKKRLVKAINTLMLLVFEDLDLTGFLDSEAEQIVKAAAAALKGGLYKVLVRDLIKAVDAAYSEMVKLVKIPRKSKKPRVDVNVGKQRMEGDHSREQPKELPKDLKGK